MPVKTFLDSKASEAAGDKDKKAALERARAQITVVEVLIQKAKGTEGDEAQQKAIEASMNKMAGDIIILLSSTEWGTKSNPVPLDYQKRRADAYPVFYLAVGADLQGLDQKELRGRYSQRGYENRIFRYAPTESTKTPGKEQTLGLGPASQIEVGQTIEFADKGTRGKRVGEFKDLTKLYGFVPSKSDLDVDHVVELQIGGQDEFPNLWPLPAGENRSSGAKIKAAKVTTPDKKEISVQDALAKRQQDPKDKSLWMIVTSTRQL
jgi:hypothetical protein